MIDYCTDQWTVIKFPCGAGGKFLSNCLFLFDKIAHWHGIQGQENIVEYFRQTMLNNNQTSWLKRELNHQWNLNFFSRSYQRNNNLNTKEFNQLTDQQGSEYFKECWNKKLIIVDHWGKPLLPKFWNHARSITIDIDDESIYENLVMKKLYTVRQDKIISLLDAPAELGTPDNVIYAKQFQNQFEFPLVDLHEFFETQVKQQPWLKPWVNYDIPHDEFVIKISELVNETAFINKFEFIEDIYKQKIPKKYLINMHAIWRQANDQCAA